MTEGSYRDWYDSEWEEPHDHEWRNQLGLRAWQMRRRGIRLQRCRGCWMTRSIPASQTS